VERVGRGPGRIACDGYGWLVGADVVIVEPGPARDAWVELLRLADEPTPLRAVLQQGVLYGVRDDDARPRAAVLVLNHGNAAAELRAVAVAGPHQGRGLGSWIVSEVCERLRVSGIRRVVVGTASSGLRQLGFYQRLGFRVSHVERDFFTPERGYPPGLSENGISSRDIVWMDQEL
jgi:ribosomal protein S18 acetylase RimI-like enzyme